MGKGMMSSSGSGSAEHDLLLELRPMGAIELVDGGLAMCSRHFGALVLVVLPGYLVLGAGVILLVSFAELPPAAFVSGPFYYFFAAIVSFLLLVSHVGHGAGVYYLYCAETGRPVGPGEALARAMRKSGSLVMAGAVSYALAGLGALLCAVPGIAAYSLFALSAPVVMVEDGAHVSALRRGYRMLRESAGRTFKSYLLVAVIWLIGVLSLHGMIQIGLLMGGGLFGLDVGLLSNAFALSNLTYFAFVSIVVLLGMACLLCAMSVLLYIDVRMRTEGIDIERRIETLPRIREETA
jgi:hypothetical protein